MPMPFNYPEANQIQISQPVTQYEFITYTRYLDDLRVIEECLREKRIARIGLVKDRFVKLTLSDRKEYASYFGKVTPKDSKDLIDRVVFIDTIHRKFAEGDLNNRSPEDCAPLVAEFYNTHLKTIQAWNKRFKGDQLEISTL